MKKLSLAKASLLSEKQSAASEARALCDACGLCNGVVKDDADRFARPFLPKDWTRKLLVVLEKPDGPLPYTSDTGRLLRRLLKRAGYEFADVAIVYALRCRPGSAGGKPKMSQIRACRPFLLGAIEHLKPKHVLVMGDTAIRAVLNRTAPALVHLRGRMLPLPGFDAVPMIFATYGLETLLDEHNAHLWKYVVFDMKRFKEPWHEYPKVHLPNDDQLAVDTEFGPAPESKLLTIGVADTQYAIAADVGEKALDGIKDHLSEKFLARTLVGHSLPGDIDQLVLAGIKRREWIDGSHTKDTFLCQKLVDENLGWVSGNSVKGALKLDNLLLGGANVTPWKEETDAILAATGDATQWSHDQRVTRCRLDAWAAALLQSKLDPKLPRSEYVQFAHRAQMALHRIYLAGAYVDMKAFHAMGTRLKAEADRTGQLLARAAAKHRIAEFTPTNTDHLRTLLFKKLKLKPIDRKNYGYTQTGLPKVDKTLLKQYEEVPEVANLIAFKKAHKLLSTWYGGDDRKSDAPALVEVVESVGRDLGLLRFRLKAHGARTARRSSGRDDEDALSATNSQNWPKEARRIVRSRWPKGLIDNEDYKSLEVVLIAWQAEDEKLFEYFTHPTKSGYLMVAKDLLGKEYEKGTIEYRTVKEVVLGSNYRMRAPKLAWKLWYQLKVRLAPTFETHLKKTARILEAYHKKFPKLREYQDERVDEVLATGKIVCETGYIRHLPCPEGRETPGFWHIANEASNVRTQHLASAITASALMDTEAALLKEHGMSIEEYHEALLLRKWPEFALPINEVHDSLVFDMHPRSWKKDREIIVETMRAVPTLRKLVPSFDIPLGVEGQIGPVWSPE